jgi:hypothetical protein
MNDERDHLLPPGPERNATGAALTTVGIPDDAIIRYGSAIKADKQLLIAHGTTADVERARDILAATNAESVEVHVGEPQPVASAQR